MKKFKYLCLFTVLSLVLLAGCGKKNTNPNFDEDTYLSGMHFAMMDMGDLGEIVLALDADAAPATVTNFVNLVKEGFYDGLTFHRIISGFMIHGGDPQGNSMGGSEYTVPGEFALNGFDNKISHVRGTISMARAEAYDSASSQFFIMHEDNTGLDGAYAAFGTVIAGMDVVDNICNTVSVEDENGTVLAANQPVIQSITMLETEQATSKAEEERPEATAIINFFTLTNGEDLPLAGSQTVDNDGVTYYITSSEDLLSLSLYKIDFSEGLEYDEKKPLARFSDVGANTYLSLTVTIPVEDLPSLLLVAEEHSGAVVNSLLAINPNTGAGYLIPVLD